MSNHQSSSYSSSSSFSFSSSSHSSSHNSRDGHNNNHTSSTGHAYSTQSYTDPSGRTTVKSTSQNLGEAPVRETRSFDAQGRELAGTAGSDRRIEDVTDREENDRAYEERIEEEYAKREGGA